MWCIGVGRRRGLSLYLGRQFCGRRRLRDIGSPGEFLVVAGRLNNCPSDRAAIILTPLPITAEAVTTQSCCAICRDWSESVPSVRYERSSVCGCTTASASAVKLDIRDLPWTGCYYCWRSVQSVIKTAQRLARWKAVGSASPEGREAAGSGLGRGHGQGRLWLDPRRIQRQRPRRTKPLFGKEPA